MIIDKKAKKKEETSQYSNVTSSLYSKKYAKPHSKIYNRQQMILAMSNVDDLYRTKKHLCFVLNTPTIRMCVEVFKNLFKRRGNYLILIG